MNTPTTFARVSATLVFSLFSSIAFAQVTQVTSRADLGDTSSLGDTDFINWQSQDDGVGNYTFFVDPDIFSDAGVAVTVTQTTYLSSIGSTLPLILQDPSPIWVPTNLPDGDYIYETNIDTNATNSVAFSNFDGSGVCDFGTQIAPVATGSFTARIEAFDDLDISMGYVDVTGSSNDPDAAFIGISSVDSMHRVEVSIVDEASGIYAAWFAVNQIDFSACVTEPPPPEAPALYCDGFAAPMANHPVKVKKNRVLPLRVELFDELGFEQTDIELIAQPVVTVLFTSSIEGSEAIDVSDDTLPAGHGSDGNQFSFSDDGFWQYNLSPRNYSATGTYLVTVDSGDDSEYVIDPTCVTSFIIK